MIHHKQTGFDPRLLNFSDSVTPKQQSSSSKIGLGARASGWIATSRPVRSNPASAVPLVRLLTAGIRSERWIGPYLSTKIDHPSCLGDKLLELKALTLKIQLINQKEGRDEG